MKWNKLLTLIITIFSISVVVFNNITQITNEIFKPTINMTLIFGFLITVIIIITYAFINRDLLK